MNVSRRKFLRIFFAFAGGAAVVGSTVSLFSYRIVQSLYHRLTTPLLAKTPPGAIDNHSLKALLAAVETILNTQFESGHYEDFFRWYAENVPGYKVLYERFAASLDRLARQFGNSDFAGCDATTKHRVLEKTFQFRSNRLHKLWVGVLESDRLLFDAYIALPILELFARTDAWVLLGYESWPGVPRGLSQYRQAPVRY